MKEKPYRRCAIGWTESTLWMGTTILYTALLHFFFCSLHAQTESTPTGDVPSLSDAHHSSILQDQTLKVFFDCTDWCYEDFLKQELSVINYVRDKEVADLQILLTTQPTTAGGTEVMVVFIGLQRFAGMRDTLVFASSSTDTDNRRRNLLLNALKLGLVRYAAKTPLGSRTTILFPAPATMGTPATDPWKNWVFNTDVSTYLTGQKLSSLLSLLGSFSANRVTDVLKIRFSISGNYSENRFDIADQRILSISRSYNLNSLVALGLDDHWSAGLFTSYFTSSFGNTKLMLNVGPGIEYNVFPYTESSHRQFRMTCKFGHYRVVYYTETIFFKSSEHLNNVSMVVSFDVREPWGSMALAVEGSQYTHDWSKNRVDVSTDLYLRMVEGLSLRLSGIGSIVNDQISLPRLGATTEEVLLQRRELATSYTYSLSAGFSFTFGSIYQNIVNVRFGR